MSSPAMVEAITEAELQAAVIGLARLMGWRVHHSRRSPRPSGSGWATALTGDPGAPDLMLARRGTVMLVELKSERGRFGAGQLEWAGAISAEIYRCWRPADWIDGTIADALR